jgi:hypothetical protein
MLSIHPVARALLLVVALTTACPALAATIYGTLKRGNQPLASAAVQLTCGTLTSAGQSDPRGNYSLSIAGSGPCILSVDGKTAPVNLGSQPVRYDFEVPAAGTSLLQR